MDYCVSIYRITVNAMTSIITISLQRSSELFGCARGARAAEGPWGRDEQLLDRAGSYDASAVTSRLPQKVDMLLQILAIR